MSSWTKVAVGLGTSAAMLTVGAFWWWALLGMTPNVGLAVLSTVTVMTLAATTALAGVTADE